MSSFTNALIIEDNGDGKTWTVKQAFQYFIGREDSNEYLDVRIGFKTDLASIPRAVRWLIPKTGKWNQAAVGHDHSYRKGFYTKDVSGLPMPMKLTRERADSIFLEAMGVLKVKPWTKYAIYTGVRVGGWISWDAARNKDVIDYPTG